MTCVYVCVCVCVYSANVVDPIVTINSEYLSKLEEPNEVAEANVRGAGAGERRAHTTERRRRAEI